MESNPTWRWIMAAGLVIFGCGDDKGTSSQELEPSSALISLSGCEDASGAVRQAMFEEMNREMDGFVAGVDAFIAQTARACAARRAPYGRSVDDSFDSAGAVGSSAVGNFASAGAPEANTASGSRASVHSDTNNQENGVDEADMVKNDGKYIYVVQKDVFRILDAWPAPSTREIARVPLGGQGRKLFIDGDRAVVYVASPSSRRPSYARNRDCSYGYECEVTGDGTSTTMLFFDVSNRAQPRKVRMLKLSGSFIAARRIGHAIHTVVTDQGPYIGGFRVQVPTPSCTEVSDWPAAFLARGKILAAYEKLRNEKAAEIASMDVTSLLSHIEDEVEGAGSSKRPICDGLHRSPSLRGALVATTLVSVEMGKPSRPETVSILSSPGKVYASQSALYMAVHQQVTGSYRFDANNAGKDKSAVHKFVIGSRANQIKYVANGVVSGRVLNQFAMDEHDGLLRVATTTGRVPEPNVESQLTILAQEGAALRAVGRVEHIAPKEDIRSVRFDGTRAFVVTFKKTDPLFVIDLGDPYQPRIRGELKIPGFSTYMHMLDDKHLLSIGYDADDHGSFAYFSGVLLQIFDVSNPEAPRLAHRHRIGTRGSSSEALTNHLAFTYHAPLKMLAVPMTICEDGGDGRYGAKMTFSGLMVFDIDTVQGIRERGRVAHEAESASITSLWHGVGCSNWWTDGSSTVKRSLFFDRFVYSIATEKLKVQSVDELGRDVASISF